MSNYKSSNTAQMQVNLAKMGCNQNELSCVWRKWSMHFLRGLLILSYCFFFVFLSNIALE